MHFLIICSIIGSSSLMVVSIVRWKRLSKQVVQVQLVFGIVCCSTIYCHIAYIAQIACVFWSQVHLLVQLALADLLAALVLLYSSAINKVSTDQRISICQYTLPLATVSTVLFKIPLADNISCGRI